MNHNDNDRESRMPLETKLDMLHEDVTEMKSVLKDLTIAINRLAVVEERQIQAAASLERAFAFLEKIDARVAVLEKQAVTTHQTSDWVGKAVWALAAAFAVFVGKKLGVI
jgi:hypothetical protein